jgi:hypothetical protein
MVFQGKACLILSQSSSYLHQRMLGKNMTVPTLKITPNLHGPMTKWNEFCKNQVLSHIVWLAFVHICDLHLPKDPHDINTKLASPTYFFAKTFFQKLHHILGILKRSCIQSQLLLSELSFGNCPCPIMFHFPMT